MRKNSEIISFLIVMMIHGLLLCIRIGRNNSVAILSNKKIITLSLNKLMITKKQVVETEYTNVKNYDVKTDQLGELNQDVNQEMIGSVKEKTFFDQQKISRNGVMYKEVHNDKDKLENSFDKEIDVGEKNSLKSKKFLYFGFYKKIKVQVDKEWNKNFVEKEFKDPNLEVLIQVAVDSNGKILKAVVDKSSNNKKFDTLALNVFNRIKNVENPPKDLMNNQNFVYILWAFSLK